MGITMNDTPAATMNDDGEIREIREMGITMNDAPAATMNDDGEIKEIKEMGEIKEIKEIREIVRGFIIGRVLISRERAGVQRTSALGECARGRRELLSSNLADTDGVGNEFAAVGEGEQEDLQRVGSPIGGVGELDRNLLGGV